MLDYKKGKPKQNVVSVFMYINHLSHNNSINPVNVITDMN